MKMAQIGSRVQIHYKCFLRDGTLYSQTEAGRPFEFVTGANIVIPGLEKTILEMEEGKTKTAVFPPEQAYGPERSELLIKQKKSRLPGSINWQPGEIFENRGPHGEIQKLRVVAVDQETVTLDGNHPLAGQTLTFEISLLKIL